MEKPPYNSEYSFALFVGENYQKKGGEVGMMDREKAIKDNAIRGLQSAIEISSALVHLRKEHAKAILDLLKKQEAEKKCCRDCEYFGNCHDK